MISLKAHALSDGALECLEALAWLERNGQETDEFEVVIRLQQKRRWSDLEAHDALEGCVRPALKELVAAGVVNAYCYPASTLEWHEIREIELVESILGSQHAPRGGAGPRSRLSALAA